VRGVPVCGRLHPDRLVALAVQRQARASARRQLLVVLSLLTLVLGPSPEASLVRRAQRRPRLANAQKVAWIHTGGALVREKEAAHESHEAAEAEHGAVREASALGHV
jgi:hypothetical protein